MALYLYVKEKNSSKRKIITYFSYMSLTIGALLLFWSFYPILSFEIYSKLFIEKNIFTPVPASNTVSSLEQANSVLGSYNVFSNNLRDFTQASLWFPSQKEVNIVKAIDVKEYKLSISKLNISNAIVKVGGEDLSKSLIHYLPQSLPGEYGHIVIFGHSTLPQMYNVKDYKTIFTYLPSLEKGDKVVLTMNDLEYEYEIYDLVVVNPDQVSVLEPKNDASYITLITCVPPGTYWKRLVVRAKLSQLPQNVIE